MRRSCGGPVGTEIEWRKECGVGVVMGHSFLIQQGIQV